MFSRQPKEIDSLVNAFLRGNSLEAPYRQRKLIAAWPQVMPAAVPYTESVEIRNQTLWVKLSVPALRNDLSMQRSDLVAQLNNKAGAMVITDIRFY